MRILRAEYLLTAVKPEQYPMGELPEIALAGRSNVGKSSLINKLAGRRGLARISSKPGKTRTLNFYRFNDSWCLVDLPGYGFANVSQQEKASWAAMINKYLTQREELRGILQIVDIRHPPSREDREMRNWLKEMGITTAVVATKADKISRGRRPQHLKIIREALELDKDIPLLAVSSETGEGIPELLTVMESILGLASTEGTEKEKGESSE